MLAHTATLITFAVYALLVISVATLATRLTRRLSDFILGGRGLSGPVTALGAGASDMGSWLLMALPGAVYTTGLSRIWMPLALLVGAYLNWRLVAPRLRVYTELADDALTLPEFFGARFRAEHGPKLRRLTAIAVILFFTIYSVAGFVSAALLLQVTFGIDYTQALWIGALVIVAHTAIGGFIAINWVDFFQGLLMLFALLAVPIVTYLDLGGTQMVWSKLQALQPHLIDLGHHTTGIGIVSLLAWGLGYFGQPHINVRFMAIAHPKELPHARRICMSWMALSLVGAVLTGILGACWFAGAPLSEPDTVFIVLAQRLFNPWVAGILLAAVLSAILSTVSAQILMTASVVVEDCLPGLTGRLPPRTAVKLSRLVTVVVALVPMLLALQPSAIIDVVALAWSGLGATFGPVLLLALYWRNFTARGALAGMWVGILCVLGWLGLELSFKPVLAKLGVLPGFVILPAFVLNSLVCVWVSKRGEPACPKAQTLFDTMQRQLGRD